jgi:hypothetical protein
MKFVTYLLLAFLLFGVVRTHWSVRKSASAEERSAVIRFSAFAWLVGALLIVAFIFLPNRQRVLLMVPTVLLGFGLGKFWRDKRARWRRENDERTRLERMKRVN